MNNMNWDWYEDIIKAEGDILSSLDKEEKKAFKKTLQAAEPTEYFGQDFTKLGELLDMMKELDLIKSDETLSKKMKTMDESNLDIIATASKLRKEYETLYRQIRKLVYPKKGGDLR
ncbi:MAG: hypothetical protein GOVbin4206_72 [Prokaryotic dsDNA virus sp.]|nr:MAG: hypothetical protein GOVbin4206_72 [Prokaryotic dsDNA virus sp.]